MNKADFISALARRFDGDRKQAQQALDSVIETITREVVRGEKVVITGFGSFEKRVREARWTRNPRTGERVRTGRSEVPKFKPGSELMAVVAGSRKAPATNPTPSAQASAEKRKPASEAAGKKSTTKKAAVKPTPSKKAAAKSSPSNTSSPKKNRSSRSGAKKATEPKRSPTSKRVTKSGTHALASDPSEAHKSRGHAISKKPPGPPTTPQRPRPKGRGA